MTHVLGKGVMGKGVMGKGVMGSHLQLRGRAWRYVPEAKPGQDEVRWVTRQENQTERQSVAEVLAGEQPERAWQLWVRVRLGAERRVDAARAYGYKDGSAITHVLKRLEAEARPRSSAATRMAELRRRMESCLSAFRS